MIRKEPIQQLIYRLKVKLGLVKPDPPDQIEELRKDPQKPPEYLRGFSLVPEKSPAEVLGREKDLESLLRAYQNWKQVHRPLLLVGEPGCGLTTFLGAAFPEFENPVLLADDHRIYDRSGLLRDLSKAFGLEEATSVEMLVEQLNSGAPRVAIFENVERVFLRTLGGFNLLEDLRIIVNQTSEQVFWILTISSYPMYYLDRISGIRSFFDNNFRYQLGPLEPTVIEAAIEQRNAGYQSIFLKAGEIPPALERSLSRADSEKKQQLLRDHFYSQLHAFANGNISRALLFWIESIQGVRGDKVYLKAFTPNSLKEINTAGGLSPGGISRQGLFALEAIFQHSSLSTEDLDKVLRSSEQSSRLVLAQLQQDNWIHPRRLRNGRQEYQINLLYQSELKQLLANEFNRNIKMN